MKILSESLSPKGRWNRFKFWIYQLVSFLILSVIIWGLSWIISASNDREWLATVSAILIILYAFALTLISIFSYIKRLRDLNQNPWFAVLGVIPLVSLWLLIYCGFFKGTQGPNQYGPDPLGAKPSDNTL